MTPRGSESDREELTKLQKEKRLVDAKIRDIQEKHRLEKRQLQSQISALRAIPASEQRMMHEAFEAERTRLEADMKKMAKELDMWKTVAMGKDGEAKFLEENRRFSGISDQSDGFYDHDDESVCVSMWVERAFGVWYSKRFCRRSRTWRWISHRSTGPRPRSNLQNNKPDTFPSRVINSS